MYGRKLVVTFVGIAAIAASSAARADDLSKGVPSQEALQKKTALKLAGLVTFVAGSCPQFKVNLERFKAAIQGLGLSTDDLNKQDNKFAYLQYTMLYQKNVKTSCDRAGVQFGPNGKTLPDLLFEVKQPAAQAPAAPAPNAAAPKAPEAVKPDTKTPDAKNP